MQIYLFTVITSKNINDNIDLQIYAKCYFEAFKTLVLITGIDVDECTMSYDGKICSASPLGWIGTAE